VDIFMLTSWQQYPAILIMLLGVALLWRGLHGGPDGERGLLRRGVEMLERIEGWRLSVLGLTLTGVGAAWFWDLRWLLVLALGIGFAELHEATHIIKAWRWDGGSTRKRSASPPSLG